MLERGGGAWEEALALAREAVADQPGSPSYNMLRGDAAANLGQWPEAIESYRAVMDLQPGLPDPYLRIRVPLFLSGRAKELAALYDRAVRHHPEMPLERLSNFASLQADARARGVPAIVLITMPKSGSLYLLMRFVDGLNVPNCHISLDLFPADHVVPAWAEDLARGGAVTQEHLDASEENLAALQRAGIDRVVVHVRDPRQAALSWMHHIDGTTGERANVRRLISPTVPDDWDERAIASRLDWTIDNHLPVLVEWTMGWVRAADATRPVLDILFTRYEDLRGDEEALFRRILDHYGIAGMPMNMNPPVSSDAALHRRKGQADEWRSVFSAAQRRRASGLLPADLCERSGWPIP